MFFIKLCSIFNINAISIMVNIIVICSQSKRDVETIVKTLKDKYEDIDICSYTSLKTDSEQLKNVNKYWAQADVIIY